MSSTNVERTEEGERREIIPPDLLETYGGTLHRLQRGDVLFDAGERALLFHQVEEGVVKMSVFTDRGREFVQGYFRAGESFGEPPFFTGGNYPATAIAVENATVWRIAHDHLLRLLREHADVHLRVTVELSRRLIYKAMMLGEIAVEEAEHRLARLIDYFRRSESVGAGDPYRVPFTRQQLADMTGLRVETVIRTVKGLEERGILEIEGGKIIWITSNGLQLLT